jgi:nonsense-mediated mRNA decay protein 3
VLTAFRSHDGKNANDIAMDFDGVGASTYIYHTRTHLGAILEPGDHALSPISQELQFRLFASLPQDRISVVVLMKKVCPNGKKNKTRNWRLTSMAEEAEESGDKRGIDRFGGRDQRKVEGDYELFLRDQEKDVEIRQAINLYKAKGGKTNTRKKGGQYGMDIDDLGAERTSRTT